MTAIATATEVEKRNAAVVDAANALRSEFRGEIILPTDNSYEETRKIWNGMINKHPAIIARCLGTSDIIKAVKFGRDHDLTISLRGGGHNVAGHAVCDGGIMIDMSLMKSVVVDTTRKTAKAEPGATWRHFDLETQAFGLASTGGLVSSTGVAGFTLGGGVGWLVRKYGLALDNLISAEVVTANGEHLRASMEENTDLFWGIRGGGGNFGVVTSFEFQLHPVGPIVLGGLLAYKAEDAERVLRFYREFIQNAPDELTTFVVFLTAPPLPFLPKEVHGSHLIAILVCYCGKIEEGQTLLEPLRKFVQPVADIIQPMPYTVVQSYLDQTAPFGLQNYWKSCYLSGLTDAAVSTILSYGQKISSPFSAIHIHQLGGAMRRIGDDATAYSHRDAPFILNIVSTWSDPMENDRHITWTRDFFLAMQRFSAGSYINFMGDDEAGRIKEVYEESKLEKLVSLKNKYDPKNVFHLNQNIKPKS
jgi:FAD/FMN-containing dehydrogenase